MDIRKTIPLPSARDPKEFREEQLGKLKEASKMYEQQFLGEMLKAMRSTVQKSDLVPETFGERLFKGKLDQEYISGWSERGGVGLGDMIYTQLKEKYFPEKLAKFGPIQGPYPVNKGEGVFKMQGPEAQGATKGPIEIEIRPQNISPQNPGEKTAPDQGHNLTAPWAGKLVFSQAHEDGSKTTVIDHGEGLRSEIKHTGRIKSMQLGQQIEAGEIIGEIQGREPLVKWNLWS